jgi:two-component system NtrC family sensor kinase
MDKTEHRYQRLRRLILVIMIVVPFIPFILVLGIGYYYFATSLGTNTIASMERIVEDHRQMIESFLKERKSELEFIIQSYHFEDLADPEKLFRVYKQLQKESPAFIDLGIFNEEGIHVSYFGPYKLVGRDYGQEAWFREVLRQGVYISDIFLGYRKIPHFIIAVAKEEEGKKWVIRATIDTYMFTELVEKVRIGKTGEAYMLNREGVFQTQRRSGGNLMERDPDSTVALGQYEGIKTFVRKDSGREEYLYATTWLRGKDWMLVVRQRKDDAFRALRSAAFIIVLISVLGGAVIVSVAFYTTGQIIRRMTHIDTEKDQLSKQLVRATRLAELGQMASGFAHEINNPLQIMKSEGALIDMIFSDMRKKEDLKESQDVVDLEDSLKQIKLQIDRCEKITQAILKFGRKTEPVIKDVDLTSFLPEVTGMVEKRAIIQGINLKQQISEKTPALRGDPDQLQQVLVNLFNNAIDAIVERHGSGGGELTVEACPDQDGKVRIAVKDNGTGISPENMKKMFTPFFTTKPVGKGTGLGLSVCYGILDGMGGTMEVSSEWGVGTTFSIRLPAAS